MPRKKPRERRRYISSLMKEKTTLTMTVRASTLKKLMRIAHQKTLTVATTTMTTTRTATTVCENQTCTECICLFCEPFNGLVLMGGRDATSNAYLPDAAVCRDWYECAVWLACVVGEHRYTVSGRSILVKCSVDMVCK